MASPDSHASQRTGVTSNHRSAWLAIGLYGCFIAALQLPWLTYAPATAQARDALGVSEGAVGDLAVVVPLCYVVLGMPAGRWLDRNLRATLAIGVVLPIAGVLIRCLDPHSYTLAMTGQLVLALGSPLALNAVTKLPARHFTSTQRTTAISLLSASQFIGILLASSTGSWLMDKGIGVIVPVHALVVVLAGIAFLSSLAIPARQPEPAPSTQAKGALRGNRKLVLMGTLMFMGIGLFNTIATWIDTVETDLGNKGAGPLVVTAMTLAGVVGAATLPPIAAKMGRRREVLMLIGTVNLVAVPMFLILREPFQVVLVAGLMGYLLFAGLPIVLDWSEEISGPDRAGYVAGFVMVLGNLGGTVYVVIVQTVLSNPHAALLVLTALVAPWVLVAQKLHSRTDSAHANEVLA